MPTLLANGGAMLWVILFAGAAGIVVFIERYLNCHRAQINSTEFLNGVRTVLKRGNVVETLSICDATSGPAARMVETAILHSEHGRYRELAAMDGTVMASAPRLMVMQQL